MKNMLCVVFLLTVLALPVHGWFDAIDGSWGTAGLTKISENSAGVEINLSLGSFGLEDFSYDGRVYQSVLVPGMFVPADQGSPNFPSFSRIIAVPEGATARIEILDYRTMVFSNVVPAPAPNLPSEKDNRPLDYSENPRIYESADLYPEEVAFVSMPWEIREVDVVAFGIIPFQWNPETNELTVYTDIKARIVFEGGNGRFGEDAFRSRSWDAILRNTLMNFSSLPKIDYDARVQVALSESRDNAEYLIIIPDDPDFIAWADTLRRFRTEQGIITQVFTLTQIGGSTSAIIENFINNAYNNWTIKPDAFLLLSDYPSSGEAYGITSPVYNDGGGYGSCVSDNIYADVGGDNFPDMVHARICAQNATQLQNIITKNLLYERTPPTDASFYDNPTSSCGWQTERWFQLCAEVVRGFWANSLGKNPVRVFAVYSGSPVVGGAWSTATNTATVVTYFSNLGYIPTTVPSGINWSATTADMLNAINNGTFMLQHRDHGSETGWGEPNFQSSHLDQLTNTTGRKWPFVYTTECLTGKYNWSGETFTEKFHRLAGKGAVGLNAASEVSYSFVNDAYVWGIYDYMWPSFDPGYGTGGPIDVRPAFAMIYGKYYLAASSWPYNTAGKNITYHLFHHHGDAYMRIYSNVPQTMTVAHSPTVYAGVTIFPVTAPAGSMIAMSVDGVLIGRAEGTGSLVNVTIDPQYPPTHVKLVVTMQDYYTYEADIIVTSASTAYVVYAYTHAMAGGHSNGQINPGQGYDATLAVSNFGSVNATNVRGYLTSSDANIALDPDTVLFGTVNAGDTVIGPSPFGFTIASGVPDGYNIPVTLVCWDSNDSVWNSPYVLTVNAPDLSATGYYGPAEIMPGDTVCFGPMLNNEGSGSAYSVQTRLRCISKDPYVTITDSSENFSQLVPGDSVKLRTAFNVIISPSCPTPYFPEFELYVQGEGNYIYADTFTLGVGSVVFNEDFEGTNTWTYTGTSCWHVTTRRSNSATHSMFSGNETGNYNNSITNARAVSPQFTVGAGVEMTFWHLYSIEGSWDGCQVQISTNGGSSWTVLTPDEGYTGTSNGNGGFANGDPIFTGTGHTTWELQHVQIPVSGNVNLCWRFGSDAIISYEGYYFDDVQIGVVSGLGVEEENGPVNGPVVQFALMRAYPNPVRGRAVIGYSVGAEVPVRLVVYDISGREVTELVNCVQGPGVYRVEWDGRDERGALVSSGTYFYRIVAGSFSDANKIVVVR